MKSIFESFFSGKSGEIRNKRGINENHNKSEKKPFDDKSDNGTISRRDFLKKGAGFLAVAAVPAILKSNFAEKAIEETAGLGNNTKEQLRELMENLADEESRRIAEDNARPIKELINYRVEGRIDLTGIDTQELLKNYWKKRYKEDPNLRNSFEKAYYEMGAYDERLKKTFKEVGIPEELCYLAIPESHWNMTARSGAGAVGPYQFIAETANRWGLKTDKKNDERMNPMRSGWACANELKYLYQKSGDWDLALSGYNGGQIWGYLNKSYKKDSSLPPYKDFLRYIEDKINLTRDEIRARKYKDYKIASGDTVGKIAEMHNKTRNEIRQLNGLKNDTIVKGQILKIPYTQEEKQKDFDLAITRAGYFENLTYPAKFKAIDELIKEGFVVAQRKPGNDSVGNHNVAVIEPSQEKKKVSKFRKA